MLVLKAAWSYYEGKCPSADSYSADLTTFKSSGLNPDKEIKVASFGNSGRGILILCIVFSEAARHSL